MSDKGLLIERSQIFPADGMELILRRENPGVRVSRHAHTYYEMMFVQDGYAFFSHRQAVDMLLPGDLAIARPGVAHSLLQCCSLELLVCSFSQQVWEQFGRMMVRMQPLRELNQPGDALHLRPARETGERLKRLFEGMEEEQAQKQTGWQENLCLLLGRVLIEYARGREQEAARAQDSRMKSLSMVQKVLAVLEEAQGAELSAAEIAGRVGAASDYMTRQFKQLTGVTPVEYQRAQRMRRACELLRRTEMTVAQVAREVGFSEVSNFSRQFKNVLGLTPREARQP